jgi:nucleotide-binding universal stress UspA family protein
MVGVTAMTVRPYELGNGNLHRAQESAEAYLDGIRCRWLQAGVPIRTQVFSGTPPELIVAVAKEQAVDMIVMSTHGRSGFSRLVYGSVAEAVLRGAHLPVLMIPIRN